jgi:MFS family permease
VTGTDADATGRLRRAAGAVAVTFFVHGLLFASWAAHIPHIKARLGVGDGGLGLALLGAPAGSVSAILVAGYLVPRFGSRRVVQVGLIGYCFSGPFVGLVGSVPGLFAALFVWGAFQGLLDISMNTQAITVERARRRPLMNGMHASWSIGAFAGAGVGTVSVALGLTLAPQLLVAGTVAAAVAGWLSVRMLLDAGESRDRAEDKPATRGRTVSPAMLLLGSITFASMLCEGAAADWSSVYLRDSLGSGAAAGGLGYTGFALAMVAVRLFGDRLLRRYPADVLLPVLAAVTSVGLGAALLIGTVWAGIVGFFLLGLGLGAVVPTAFSAAGRLPDIHPAVGVAGVSGLGWAGFVFGPPIIGQLAAATSLPVALGLVPLLTAFIAVATRRVAALRHPAGLDAAAAAG